MYRRYELHANGLALQSARSVAYKIIDRFIGLKYF